jgi:hypothetical protein
MKAIKITFKEPAILRIFTDQTLASPCGPSQEVMVTEGEVWYAPASSGNQLAATANKQIPVDNNSFGKFHLLGRISRTLEEGSLLAEIAAENIGTVVARPHVPRYEAKLIQGKTLDTMHEDFVE